MNEEVHWEDIVAKVFRREELTDTEASWWAQNRDTAEVKEEWEFLTNLHDPLLRENRVLLKKQLQSFENKQPAKALNNRTGKLRSMFVRSWRYAAAVLLLIVAGVLIWQNQEADYVSEYFEPYPNIINPVLKGDPSSRNPIELAMSAYENQEYESAISYFQQINAPSDTIRFYQGNAYLGIDQPAQALFLFEDLVSSSSRFGGESQWFQTLSLVALDRDQEAVAILESMAQDEDHPYYAEARDLLEKIK